VKSPKLNEAQKAADQLYLYAIMFYDFKSLLFRPRAETPLITDPNRTMTNTAPATVARQRGNELTVYITEEKTNRLLYTK